MGFRQGFRYGDLRLVLRFQSVLNDLVKALIGTGCLSGVQVTAADDVRVRGVEIESVGNIFKFLDWEKLTAVEISFENFGGLGL